MIELAFEHFDMLLGENFEEFNKIFEEEDFEEDEEGNL